MNCMPFKITDAEMKRSIRFMKILTYNKNEKVYCKFCNCNVNKSYYEKHLLTKKHINNSNCIKIMKY